MNLAQLRTSMLFMPSSLATVMVDGFGGLLLTMCH